MKSNGYIAAFGLGPGVPLLNRAKGIVLITYCGGLLAIALVRRLRRDRYLFALLMLTLIYFVVLAFVSPSRYYYYLPHTTMSMAACLALPLLQWGENCT